ncbi:MAG: 30S ribosomal protein S8 [Elusimicrobiota bacterium]
MDTIANMLTSIRNASMKNKEKVEFPYSKLKANILKVLKDEGFISNYRIMKDEADKANKKQNIRVILKYTENKTPIINGIKRMSKPGIRIYRSYDNMPRVRAAFGVNIVSTPKGIMSDKAARKEKVGGEVICQVW